MPSPGTLVMASASGLTDAIAAVLTTPPDDLVLALHGVGYAGLLAELIAPRRGAAWVKVHHGGTASNQLARRETRGAQQVFAKIMADLATGCTVTVADVQRAFSESSCRVPDLCTVYRLLRRNGWIHVRSHRRRCRLARRRPCLTIN